VCRQLCGPSQRHLVRPDIHSDAPALRSRNYRLVTTAAKEVVARTQGVRFRRDIPDGTTRRDKCACGEILIVGLDVGGNIELEVHCSAVVQLGSYSARDILTYTLRLDWFFHSSHSAAGSFLTNTTCTVLIQSLPLEFPQMNICRRRSTPSIFVNLAVRLPLVCGSTFG
jgi:hypothetical protein